MARTTAEALEEARALEGPLGAKLAYYAEQLRTLVPAIAAGYDRLVLRLAAGEVGAHAPEAGAAFPDFLLPASDGRLLSSAALFATHTTVISFNRGHWCPFCRLETAALSQAAPEIAARGGQIVCITPERAVHNNKLRADAHADFLFLCDVDNALALELGIAMRVDDDVQDLLRNRKIDLARYQTNDGWMLPLPATFVVGQGGTILARFVDPDFRKRATVDDILAALPK